MNEHIVFGKEILKNLFERENIDFSELAVNNILKNQTSDKEKRKRADFIVNSGIGYRFTRNQVKDILLKAC